MENPDKNKKPERRGKLQNKPVKIRIKGKKTCFMKRTLLQRLLSWLGFNSFKPPSPPPPEPSSPPQMFS